MKVIKQTELNTIQKEHLFELWNNEYPENLAHTSIENIENYLNNLAEQTHYLVFSDEDKIEGWAVTFTRENEKWFAIILSEKLHKKGIGTKLLDKLKEDEEILNGWVIDHHLDKKSNGNFYRSPLGFYQKNGFNVMPETRLELEVMSAVKIKWTAQTNRIPQSES